MDLSSLAEAIPTPIDNVGPQWTVAAHKRPVKKGPIYPAAPQAKPRPEGQPERSRHNRRARRKPRQLDKKPDATAYAAAETQREPVPSTSRVAETHQDATKPPSPAKLLPPPRPGRRKPRGDRGRRTAAAAPTAPEKEQLGKGNVPDERASSKRARLDETQSPRGEAKRAKTDARTRRTVSYADASQSHLKVAVVTVPPRDLSADQADQLREAIDECIEQAILAPPTPSAQAPSFRGRPFLLDGALAMWCEDLNALSWLEKAVKALTSPIPGTSLDVIKQTEMKKKLKAGLLIHTSITEAAKLHKFLCAQNPWYKVDSWQCYDMTVDDKPQGGSSKEKVVHLILGIPEDQRQTILDRDRRVAHMSGSGYIRFFTPEETTPAVCNTAAKDEIVVKGTSTPEPSTSAPQQGPSEEGRNSPLPSEGSTSGDEDAALRSP